MYIGNTIKLRSDAICREFQIYQYFADACLPTSLSYVSTYLSGKSVCMCVYLCVHPQTIKNHSHEMKPE